MPLSPQDLLGLCSGPAAAEAALWNLLAHSAGMRSISKTAVDSKDSTLLIAFSCHIDCTVSMSFKSERVLKAVDLCWWTIVAKAVDLVSWQR